MCKVIATAGWVWPFLERVVQHFDINAADGKLRAGLFMSLLSVWLLVGVFTYLNYYTRRRYFSIWTVAWLFYALYLTLSYTLYCHYGNFDDMGHHRWWATMLKQWMISTTAVFMLWGSLRFLGKKVRQVLLVFFLAFLFVWSFAANWPNQETEPVNPWARQMPIFLLISLSSVVSVWGFTKYRRKRKFLGAGLLTFGFLIWGLFVAAYPILQAYAEYMSTAFFTASVLQMFIAVNMIILVLEQVRYLREKRALNQLKSKEREKEALQARVFMTEERYRRLYEQSSEPIVIALVDDLVLVGVNGAAARLLGISQGEACQYSLADFFETPAPGVPPLKSLAWFEHASRQRFLKLIRKDGLQLNVELYGSTIDFAGETTLQCYLREVTEQSRMEQLLYRAEKLSTLGLMVSGVAHELNNPLSVNLGHIEMALLDPSLSPGVRDHLNKARSEVLIATRRLRNFLNLSREGGMEKQTIDLNGIIRNVIELRRSEFLKARIEVELKLDAELPTPEANLDQIQQVILVLATNAIQALAGLDREGQLRLTTRHDEEKIYFLMEDNGPGVPEHLRAKIFEPFFTTKPADVGTGLGLSLAYSFLFEHGGRICYQESSLGGAGFAFELPWRGVNVIPQKFAEADSSGPADRRLSVANAREMAYT